MRTRVDLRTVVFSQILIVIFLLSFSAFAENQREINVPQKRICIVLDDSGSMTSSQRIDYSLYALEVFSALMGENDEIWLYTLNQNSKSPVLQIQGNVITRMEEIHKRLSNISANGNTPYGKVSIASQQLMSLSNDYEKWLVILSDGEFGDRTNKEVQNDLNSFNEHGIHTVFLSIDPRKENVLQNNGELGIYFQTDSSHILDTVSNISNIIFSHLQFPDNKINKSGETYILDIDIPIDQLIVFTQGKNTDVKTVMLNNSELNSTARYSAKNPYDNGNTSLNGIVYRYDQPEGKYFEGGRYQVTVSKAEKVQFYYRPAVELECSLVNSGKLFAGDEQEAKVFFSHPGTGNQVTSDLLSGAEMYLTVTNNGIKLIDNEKAGPNGEVKRITLSVGSAEVSAYAYLPGFITLRKLPVSYEVVVKPTPTPIPTPTPAPASLQNALGEIRQIDLKNNTAISFIAQIVDAEPPHNLVDEKTWNKAECRAEPEHGIQLSFSKVGVQCPEIRIIPSAAGKLSDVETGDLDFTVYTFNTDGNETRSEISVRIIPFEPIQVLDASKAFNQISLGNTNTTEFVEITVVDKETGSSLSDDIFQYTELQVFDTGNGLNWIVEKTQKNGIWKLTPQASGKKADIITGSRTIRLEALYDDGYDFTGTKAIRSSGALNLTIDKTPPRSLDLMADPPSDTFLRARQNLEKHISINLIAKFQGNDIPLSLWDASQNDTIHLDWDSSKFDLDVEKSTNKGIWEVRVKPYEGKGYLTSSGSFDVNAEFYCYDPIDEVPYSGFVQFTVILEPDWLGIILEFWMDWWWAIIGTIITLGYLLKKKFAFLALWKMRRIGISYVKKGKAFGQTETTTPKVIQKELFTFLLPFIAQRVIIQGSHVPANCSFGDIKAKAIKRFNFNIFLSRFTISNRSFSLSSIESINNITRDVLENIDLRKKEFKLVGFNIEGEGKNGDLKVVKMSRR